MSGIGSTRPIALYDTMPIGAIIAFPSAAIPGGWLECNGQAISRTNFAQLFLLLGTTYGVGDGVSTFNLPDYRGVFLRGKDNGKGYDASRALGDTQQDALQGHKHETTLNSGNANFGTGQSLAGNYATSGGAPLHLTNTPTSDGTNGTPRLAAETRPKNVSVILY